MPVHPLLSASVADLWLIEQDLEQTAAGSYQTETPSRLKRFVALSDHSQASFCNILLFWISLILNVKLDRPQTLLLQIDFLCLSGSQTKWGTENVGYIVAATGRSFTSDAYIRSPFAFSKQLQGIMAPAAQKRRRRSSLDSILQFDPDIEPSRISSDASHTTSPLVNAPSQCTKTEKRHSTIRSKQITPCKSQKCSIVVLTTNPFMVDCLQNFDW